MHVNVKTNGGRSPCVRKGKCCVGGNTRLRDPQCSNDSEGREGRKAYRSGPEANTGSEGRRRESKKTNRLGVVIKAEGVRDAGGTNSHETPSALFG